MTAYTQLWPDTFLLVSGHINLLFADFQMVLIHDGTLDGIHNIADIII